MGKIIISKLYNQDFLFLFNDDHDILHIKSLRQTMVDKVFIGRICEINQGLNACFVSISPEQKVFVSLSDFKNDTPKCGDNVVIQIKTDALKTKLPQGTTEICFPGQYCVCHLDGVGLNVSKKLDSSDRTRLMEMISDTSISGINDFRWVLRTNAGSLVSENNITPLVEEIEKFIILGNRIREQSKYLSLYTELYAPSSEILSVVGNISTDEYEAIITDSSNYYEILKQSPLGSCKDIKLYDDEYISLKNLHSLETYLLRATDKKVYLDCGGYLVIEPTEAMTVIDVNSGKAESRKKETNGFIYKVNKEAAIEVAKQLRIRNISGMIMVDFINMNNSDDVSSILSILKEELNKDRIKTTLVDMTPLGIVEITRKKIDISLDKTFSR